MEGRVAVHLTSFLTSLEMYSTLDVPILSIKAKYKFELVKQRMSDVQ